MRSARRLPNNLSATVDVVVILYDMTENVSSTTMLMIGLYLGMLVALVGLQRSISSGVCYPSSRRTRRDRRSGQKG